MNKHSWCRDIPRDEAVRAAEDNRSGPLPTLEECIERQKHAAMTAGVKEGFVKADGEWKRLTDDELRQILMIPKSVSASSAVEHENKGDDMAANGLQTAEMTLEVVYDPGWLDSFEVIGDKVLRLVRMGLGKAAGESVRLVDLPLPFAAVIFERNEAREERDAAIRERDEVKQHHAREGAKCAALADRVIALKARAASLEEAIAGVTERRPPEPGGGGNVTGFTEPAKCSPSLSESGEGQSGLRTERVTLECVHRFGKPPREWDWWRLMALRPGESVRVVEEAALGPAWAERIPALRRAAAAIREQDEAIRDLRSVTAERAKLEEQLESVACRAATAENRVAELESAAKLAPAANAAAESNHAPAASGAAGTEPVAWGIANPGNPIYGNHKVWTVRATEEIAKDVYHSCDGWVHFPLYAAPQPEPGWLTAEEREAVTLAAQQAPESDFVTTVEGKWINKTLTDLLARDTPPEVVLPGDCGGESYDSFVGGWNNYRDEALKALAAAGVAVKEVERE